MADFVELGAEGVNWVTEKHWDTIHDTVSKPFKKKQDQNQNQNQKANNSQNDKLVYSRTDPPPPSQSGKRRRQKNRLPEPEDDIKNWDKENYRSRRDSIRSASLDRESQRSEQVLRAYESDPRDPPARAETVLSKKDLKKLNRDRGAANMSYANGGYGYGNQSLAPGQYDQRRSSQPPPRSRYYDDDDGSDYDEKSGRRYRTTGRGYDDGYDDDRDYDREVITTERYKGPARQGYDRRESYGTSRDGPYGGGAVTQYNRKSTTEVDDYRSKRSQSRGRRDRDRDRSRSRSRSRSSSEHSGIRGKIDDTFDTSLQGLGVGLAGAVVGGLAGREFGHKHKNRDILLGALVGGLGANAAENKWRDWKDDKERDLKRDEDRWEQRWDGRDYGRSRSAMR